MEWIFVLRWLHVVGAAVLLGTGAGIAFFMVMAQRSGDVAVIAHTARVVVIADGLLTATVVVAQPVTGWLLAEALGWPLSESWIVAALGLYVLVGAFWLPVVWIQIRLRDMAREAAGSGAALPAAYGRFYRIWFACGVPAFLGVLGVVWLMIARPALW